MVGLAGVEGGEVALRVAAWFKESKLTSLQQLAASAEMLEAFLDVARVDATIQRR